jgi:preprotein translocase subunit SecF
MNTKTKILDRLILTQAVIFSVLFAIWALPETILVRNICLIIGALIGLYEIVFYRANFTNKKSVTSSRSY